MNNPNIFIPSNQRPKEETASENTLSTLLVIKKILAALTQFLVIAGIGLLPLLFMIGTQSSTSFDRVFSATLIAGAALVVASVLFLFKKRIVSICPMSLTFLGLFVLWGFLSAFVQGDSYDSIWGIEMEQLTVAFSVLLLVYVGLPLLLQSSAKMLLRALGLIGVVALVVVTHTALWYWFGLPILSLGELSSSFQSLIGGFNDSAIYSGLIVIFGLTTLIMLPLRTFAQAAITVVTAIALSVLLLVNFSFVWFALALVSLVTTGYALLRKLLFQSVPAQPIGGFAKLVSFIILVVSLLAVVYGSQIAEKVEDYTQNQFIEVRPSFEASVSIVNNVYKENLWLGVGPNRFDDAWRLHKDVEINEVVLWDTDFNAGYSHVVSVFATYGLIGGLLLVLFHLSFIWFGVTRLTKDVGENLFARYVTTITFVGALFLWAMTYVYTPSVALMLLAASLTGLTFATSAVLDGARRVTVETIINRRRGFVILFVSILCIGLTVWAMASVTNKYFEQTNIQDGVVTENDEIVGLLANQKINDLTAFVSVANPESVNQESLLNLSKAALEASREAVDLDPTNPNHLERLASLYSLLGAVGVNGGYASALDTLDRVIAVDPKNPKHHLATARLLVAEDDLEGARVSLTKALNLKRNYTQAIRLETEIIVATGDAEETINRIEGIVQLDSGTAARWYQLGVLYGAVENSTDAINALLQAIQIDPSYADARYMLALEYLKEDRRAQALSQLKIVEKTNPDNQQLLSLIVSVENGEPFTAPEPAPVFERALPVVDSESGVSVPSEVSTDLIAPVNAGAPVNGS